ncbi:MAG: alpha/beta hydrolase [Rhizobiales bacterium]|nr:alpha/beta hydrolase [Hyphomicrobiales bacterium]
MSALNLKALLLLSVAACVAPMAAQPAAAAAKAAVTTKVLEVPLPEGGEQRILLISPAHPKAAILMLPGGAGIVGLTRDGGIRHRENFVVRTRALWTARGYAVLIPDTIHRSNLRGERSSPRYGRLIERLIGIAHERTKAPVFVLGTSQGAIAAVNGAAHARPGSLAGVILTEPVSVKGGSRETVFDANPANVHAPVLVVSNRDDRCAVAAPAMAPKVAAAMTGSKDVKTETVSGGTTRSWTNCGSLSPHGYYGIEGQVVARISGWMDRHL